MAEPKIEKHKLDLFGRNLTLMLNRASMYTVNHPYVKQAIDVTYEATTSVLDSISPLVFIMTQEKFFIDEEPLDPRVNTGRIVNHFKKKGIQSVSFERGLEKRELRSFVEIYSTPDKYPDADAIKKALAARRIRHLKINHVFYKKVTADDEIISKDALRKITPDMMEQEQAKSKKMFLDALLESILTEEFLRTLDINELVKDPKGFSHQMIEAGIEGAKRAQEGQGGGSGVAATGGTGVGGGGSIVGGGAGHGAGPVLVRQLELIEQEIERNIAEGGSIELPDLANALFEMKKELMKAIEEQKALGLAFSDEETIVEKANQITDRVLIRLVKQEYAGGQTSVPRLAQIIRRLVPDPQEIKRLLPKIKTALLAEGMPLEDYLQLIRELGKELKGEELAKVLEESSEEIGIDPEQLLEEVRNNPARAAELIYLAVEIRKGSGDDKVLSDILIEYIERLGTRLSEDFEDQESKEGEQHVRTVMSEIQSKILEKLKGREMHNDILARLEERINQRVDEMLDRLRLEWLERNSGAAAQPVHEELSVLETLEQSVGQDEELADILKVVRTKVDAEEIDENDFAQIHREILNEWKRRESERAAQGLPAGILDEHNLLVFLEKELARVARYNIPFSAAAFTVVKAKPRVQVPSGAISRQDILDKVLHILAHTFRETDIVGQVGKNKIVALLPMTPLEDAKLAMRRVIRIFHSKPIEINGLQLDLRVAGAAIDMGSQEKSDTDSFLKALFQQLSDMATRIRNIHAFL